MIYRKDESKEDTIAWLEAIRMDLKRELRTIENAIDWISQFSISTKNEVNSQEMNYSKGQLNDTQEVKA